MDVLSDVLRVLRLTGGAFFTAEFTSPWSVFTPSAEEIAHIMAMRAENLAVFHIFVEGECWISPEGAEPFALSAGSAVIFPHSPSHEMGSRPDLTPEPIVPLLTHPEGKAIPQIIHGGGGARTRFFCGYLQCDYRFNPLIGALPPLIVATPDEVGDKATSTGTSTDGVPPYAVLPTGDEWLKHTLEHLLREAYDNRPGTPAMLARLVEVFYVEVLRRYAAQATVAPRGWFAAMNDAEVGRALRLLHAEPARKWTVDELASEVGISRSAFAQRFTDLVGESPMRYLTNWRMQRAKDLLLQNTLSLPQIAERVGYDSDAAFSHAFKRNVGDPPVGWKEQFLARAGQQDS